MAIHDLVKAFDDAKIRVAWDDIEEKWYLSVVDVAGVLTEQQTSRGASTYWAVLKKRLADEGANELLTNCKRLKAPLGTLCHIQQTGYRSYQAKG